MDNIRDLIPTHKLDIERAEAAIKAGYPAVEPILDRLIEWLQDCNWPVAHVVTPFLQSVGAPLVPHIWHVLRTNDDIWKYWVVGNLIRSLPEEAAVEFRPELERLAYNPKPNERTVELDEKAREALEHFGWTRRDA
jgi:Domain of unknown function (DUF5071)